MLPTHIARRAFLSNSGLSLGSMALASLLPRTLLADDQAGAARKVDRWTGAIDPLHHERQIKTPDPFI